MNINWPILIECSMINHFHSVTSMINHWNFNGFLEQCSSSSWCLFLLLLLQSAAPPSAIFFSSFSCCLLLLLLLPSTAPPPAIYSAFSPSQCARPALNADLGHRSPVSAADRRFLSANGSTPTSIKSFGDSMWSPGSIGRILMENMLSSP
jgi:hypothetical protein